MQNYETKLRRKQTLLNRVNKPDSMYSYCRIPGCPNPCTAGTTKGLNRLYCRKHEDHLERHGSCTKRSYKASEINPYRKAALKWIKENEGNQSVSLAIIEIKALYRNAGRHVEAFRLNGLKPEERARVAWARLREKNVNPQIPLATWLAVEMITLDDLQSENKPEFKQVQAAKIIHRQASGSHKRWEQVKPDGKIKVVELHKYPQSRGLVLRHLGEQLKKAAETLVEQYLGKVQL